MPSIMTLEGRNISSPNLGWMHPDVRLGGYGASPGCVNCAVLSDTPSQYAPTDATNIATSITNFTTQLVAAQKAAMIVGLFGSLVGVVAGAFLGRRLSKKHHTLAAIGGATFGGAGIGYGAYFIATQALMPTYVPPPAASTAQVLSILSTP